MPSDHTMKRSDISSIRLISCLSYVLLVPKVHSFHPGTRKTSPAYHVSGSFGLTTSTTRRRAVIALFSTTEPTSRLWPTTPDDEDDSTSRAPVGVSLFEESSTSPTGEQTMLLEKYSMPWSDVQDWALRDNLPKYTITIPLESSVAEKNSALVVALWRTMLSEIPELAGYPIDFLQEKCQEHISSKEDFTTKQVQVTPLLLPYLDDFSFAAAGGISGKVYGIPGLADGTRIETSAVTNLEVTLPRGFVRTSDGKAAYELGRPMQNDGFAEATSNDLAKKSLSTAAKAGSFELLKTVKNAAQSGVPEPGEGPDEMLVRLGLSTGMLLAGAAAMNMLSHHLTVNIFWV